MANFGNYLGDIIAADFDGHRAKFAAVCGLTPASITNYLTKGEIPSSRTLGRVANAVQDSFKRAELIAAYWADIQAVADISGIAVVVTPEREQDSSSVDRELDIMLRTIRLRARHDPAFRKIVSDIAAW